MPTTQRLIGAWRLVSPVSDGILYYDASGAMSVQTGPRRAPLRAGDKPTSEEALAAIQGYVAYFGTFTVDEAAGTVTHHQAGTVQPGPPGDLTRACELTADNRLILRPVDRPGEIVWRRIGSGP